MKRFLLLGLILPLFFIVSCVRDPNPYDYLAPNVESVSSYSDATEVSVTIQCDSPDCNYSSYGVYFGTNSSLSDGVMHESQSGDVTIFGLIPDKTYYFKTYIRLGDYEVTSDIRSIDTKATKVTLYSISDINTTSAKLTLELDNYKIVKECGFYYSTHSDMANKRTYVADVAPISKYYHTGTINGLEPSTKYYYCAYIKGDGFEITTDIFNFTTHTPYVTLNTITGIGKSEATLTMSIGDYSSADECGLYLSTSYSMYEKTKYVVDTDPLIHPLYTRTISGLTASTTYYCRAYIKQNGSEYVSDIKSFTTIAAGLTYTGNKIISTQNELKNFFDTYDIVDGNLIIGTCYTTEPSNWTMSWTVDGVKYYFVDNSNINDFSPLSNLRDVTGYFGMSSLTQLTNLNFLSSYRGTKLYIYSCDNLTSLQGIEKAADLSVLTAKYNYSLSNISAITSLTDLQEAYLSQNSISSIPSGINFLSKLSTLDLEVNEISSLSPLYGNNSLKVLKLHWNNISDISALSSISSLYSVTLSHNRISSISALSGLNIAVLYLGYNSSETNTINDLSPLNNMTTLYYLYLNYLPVTPAQVSNLKSLLPNCTIYSTGITGTSIGSAISKCTTIDDSSEFRRTE